MITYPRNTDATYVLYKKSTQEVINNAAPYPRADGGEIVGLDPDLVYLERKEGLRPDYDPRYFVLVRTDTPDVDNGNWNIVYTTEKRPVEEIEQVVENIEAASNQQVVPYEKQLKYLLLGVGLCLHQIDGQTLTAKQAQLRSLIISKAVKLWKNDNVAEQLKSQITSGNEPDLDGAAWEKS